MSQLTLQRISQDDIKLSPKEFWEKIYRNHINPRPVCDLCHCNIDSCDQWVSFTCECPKYYHRDCMYSKFGVDTCVCPDCKNNTKWYAKDSFICKFLDRQKFVEIYQRSTTNLSPQMQLKIYEQWFCSRNFFTPPLLDLYTYLENHDQHKTLEFLKSYSRSEGVIKNYDPGLNLSINENGHVTDATYDAAISASYVNQKVFVDLGSFRKKFKEFCYDLVGDDFPWSDTVYLVGGTVHKCLESRIDVDKIPEYCNVDIFVVNPNVRALTKETKRVIKYFQGRLGEDIYWLVRKNVINIYVPGYNRSIQISMYKNNIENILHQFDFSHIQYAYNGTKVLATLSGIQYASLLVSVHSNYYDMNTYPKRLYKAKSMGLCLALPEDKVLSRLSPVVVNHLDYWYPTYTDDLKRIKRQLKNIYRIDQKYITETKPFKIFYSKVPTDFNTYRPKNNQPPIFFHDSEVVNFIEQELLNSDM